MRAAALFLLLVVAAGCGGKTAAPAEKHHVVRPSPDCTTAAPGYRTCFAYRAHPATIERRSGSSWTVVAGPLKPLDAGSSWGRLWRSPDRRTLLAEWLYPCDGHLAVFVPASGGKPRVVTGERDWLKAPPSVPLGWTAGGKARVELLRSWRGIHVNPLHPRVMLFDPATPATHAHAPLRAGC